MITGGWTAKVLPPVVKINFQQIAINNNKGAVVGLIINGKIILKIQKFKCYNDCIWLNIPSLLLKTN